MELNESVLLYLQRDYGFIVVLMLSSQYLPYLRMFKHPYSHLQDSVASLQSQWVISRSTYMCTHGWCSRGIQSKYLWLFIHRGRENGPMTLNTNTALFF